MPHLLENTNVRHLFEASYDEAAAALEDAHRGAGLTLVELLTRIELGAPVPPELVDELRAGANQLVRCANATAETLRAAGGALHLPPPPPTPAANVVALPARPSGEHP